ncbi:MAG TPA: hypothetical protein VJ721_09125 [Chthoniobacterales bacterium]|nr:hypothetical protein [Chthoniobacterales bacterium]
MISPLNFFVERHLGFNHGRSGIAFDPHPAHEIGQLDFGRTSHHDHAIAEVFTVGFIKKWNVCKEKFGRCAVLIRFNAPLPANPRMENIFERLPFGGVLENYGPKRRPIQVPAWRKNGVRELVNQLSLNLLETDQSMGSLVGVEKSGAGQDLAQTLAESAFTRGNSPRYPDSWHLFGK